MKKTVLIALLLVVVLALGALIGLRLFGARGGEAAPPAETEAPVVTEAVETEQPTPAASEGPDAPIGDTEDAAAGAGTDLTGD